MQEHQSPVKRRPGYPITINKNVDQVREKIQAICKQHEISASALFEVIVDKLTDEQWDQFAKEAHDRKSNKSADRKSVRLGLAQLSDEELAEVAKTLREKGINITSAP